MMYGSSTLVHRNAVLLSQVIQQIPRFIHLGIRVQDRLTRSFYTSHRKGTRNSVLRSELGLR